MLRTLRIIFILLLCLPALSRAENMLVDVNLLYSVPDAGGNDDFHTGKTLFVNYNYYYHSWLVATAGIFVTEEISTKPVTDVVGTFQTTINSYGLTFGVRSEYSFSELNKVYVRGGLLFYRSKLTVDEFFKVGVPVASSSADTDGLGYSVALAWAHSLTKQVSFQLELATMTQLDLFKGKSSKPFDLTNSGVSIGLGYAF